MRRVLALVAALALGCAPVASADRAAPSATADWPTVEAGAPVEREWLRVLLGGRRVGVMETTRRDDGALVETTESMRIVLERDGSAVRLETTTTSIEAVDGTPLAFRSESRLSGQRQIVEGRVEEGRRATVAMTSPAGREVGPSTGNLARSSSTAPNASRGDTRWCREPVGATSASTPAA